jgi:hypothetical protein
MSAAWDFWMANGAMTNADYPYRAVDQQCMHDSSSSDLVYIGSRGQISTTITDVIN